MPGEQKGIIQKFKKFCFLSLLLFPGLLFGAEYNLIKDSDFEQPKPNPWEERECGDAVEADSYYLGGYNSEHCGFTNTIGGGEGDYAYAKLIQEISKRKIEEVSDISWYYLYVPKDCGINYFGIDLITTNNDTLTYMYKGSDTYRVPFPEETEKRKIVELEEKAEQEWWYEKRNVKQDWEEKFGLERLNKDTLCKVELMAYWARGPPASIGETVRWDNVELLSSRYDHNYAVLSIDSEKPLVGQSYVPKASFKNVGAFEDTARVVFNISGKEGLLYSDTLEAVLGIDEEK